MSDPQTDVTGDDPILTGKIALAHMKELVGYVNPSSCCSAVFVDQSAESVTSPDLSWWKGLDGV